MLTWEIFAETILCCVNFDIHVNRICSASTDFKDILDEFGLVQSVELPTLKSGNTLDLVIGPLEFEICLVSVFTSDHNWLNFDCLKFLLENRARSVGFLVGFNEDCCYHLWSIVWSPRIDSFLETLQTINAQHAPEMEKVISKRDCRFYGNTAQNMKWEHERGNGVKSKDHSEKRVPPSIDYICKLRQKLLLACSSKTFQVFGEETSWCWYVEAEIRYYWNPPWI